jgi:hypothetical protein
MGAVPQTPPPAIQQSLRVGIKACTGLDKELRTLEERCQHRGYEEYDLSTWWADFQVASLVLPQTKRPQGQTTFSLAPHFSHFPTLL